jgi:hypothetical protein
MTKWTEREGELAARAGEIGYTLIPPSGDRWLLVEQDSEDHCWSTYDDLDEVEARIAADEPEPVPADDEEDDEGEQLVTRYTSGG